MALPTTTDLKSYLRIEDTTEDTLLAALLVQAKAMLETLMGGLPITALTGQNVIDRSNDGLQANPITVLMTPHFPVTVNSVKDADNVTVDSSTYTVDTGKGLIYANRGVTFENGPYTINCDYGLSLSPRYSTMYEPILSRCILDIASDLYQRRTPGASSESAAGSSVSWDTSRDVLSRVQPMLRALRVPMVAV